MPLVPVFDSTKATVFCDGSPVEFLDTPSEIEGALVGDSDDNE